jgi:hypothetical protein
MSPSAPKPPPPPPAPPTVDTAAQQADAANLIRRRQGYAATVLSTQGKPQQTRTGTAALLGASGSTGGTPLGSNPVLR